MTFRMYHGAEAQANGSSGKSASGRTDSAEWASTTTMGTDYSRDAKIVNVCLCERQDVTIAHSQTKILGAAGETGSNNLSHRLNAKRQPDRVGHM